MTELDIDHRSRRDFLRSLPAAAAAGFAVTDSFAPAQSAQPAGSASSYQLFTAGAIQADIKALQMSPGNNNLVTDSNFTVALTVESGKSAKEFEWHEGRDHVLQVLSGSTVVEVGGNPQNGHSITPGEWRAPVSEGATALTINQGDILVIPRNTPHRRTTSGTVALLLISPQGTAA